MRGRYANSQAVSERVTYQKQSRPGGTWYANHYPGLMCDVPIHVYTLPFNPKHDWKSFLASGPEILEYIQETTKKFDLERFVEFDTRVLAAVFDEASGKWNVTGKYILP